MDGYKDCMQLEFSSFFSEGGNGGKYIWLNLIRIRNNRSPFPVLSTWAFLRFFKKINFFCCLLARPLIMILLY